MFVSEISAIANFWVKVETGYIIFIFHGKSNLSLKSWFDIHWRTGLTLP